MKLTWKCKLIVPVEDADGPAGHVTRTVDLPCPPVIGMTVGAKRVVEIYVLQGGGDSAIELVLEPVSAVIAVGWVHDGAWNWD